MGRILNSILSKKIAFLSFFVKPNPKKITFIRKYYFDTNVIPVYEKMKNKKNGFQVDIIHQDPETMGFFSKFKTYSKLLKSKIIVSTHEMTFKRKKNITVNLWHGVPFKGTDLMKKPEKIFKYKNDTDYVTTYSSTTRTMLNACLGIHAKKYIVTGSPRNDYLLEMTNVEKKKKILECEKDEKIIFYTPTYRKYLGDDFSSFITNLGLDDFDILTFNSFLQENNLKFVTKVHPDDQETWSEVFEKARPTNFKLLTEDILRKNSFDLYSLMSVSDLLITDYSSVYIDYLITDKPMIFLPTDLKKYRETHNLLLEPYDFFTPGPQCKTQNSLEKEIKKCIDKKEYYGKEREKIRKIFHKYVDASSTDRVVEFLESL